jgi:hypothetical protein
MTDDELAEFKVDYDAQQLRHASTGTRRKPLLLTKPADQISKEFSSKITDGRLSPPSSSSAPPASWRSLPTGTVRALTKKNRGLAAIMSLFLTKYIQVQR